MSLGIDSFYLFHNICHVSHGVIVGSDHCQRHFLIGAVFQLVAIIPTFFKLYSTEDAIYKILMVPYDLSMGLISIYMAFIIAYSYAKSLKMQAVTTALNSLLVFLIVAAPIKTAGTLVSAPRGADSR